MSKTFWAFGLAINSTLAGFNGAAAVASDGNALSTIAFLMCLTATFICISRLLDK
jgi:hypothetical protein